MERAKAKLIFVLRLTLAIIIILLSLNFRNIAKVLITMGKLPLTMIGGIWLLYVEGVNFSVDVGVGVGFRVFAGVAVEIGVIMQVYLNQAYNETREWYQVYKKFTADSFTDKNGYHTLLLNLADGSSFKLSNFPRVKLYYLFLGKYL